MNTLMTTCGADRIIKTFQLGDGSIINCMIMDTAGQERFDSLNVTYYKKADAVLLVYDISNRKSFDKIKNFYVATIKENCDIGIPILLLGNKTDKEDERVITYEEGIALAIENNYEFKESSCLNNINVAGAFETLIERWNFENQKLLRTNSLNNSQNNIISKEEIKSSNNKKEKVNKKHNVELSKDKLINKKKGSGCCL